MENKIVFIINPKSGKRGKGPIRKEKVDAFIRENDLNARAVLTERVGHATEIAKQAIADGVERIVSVGGDGTMNEIAKVMVGTSIPLGLVPMGSGNGLARHLNLPLRFEDALEVVIGKRIIPIDTGEADGHPFFNVMGFGFDAMIGKRFNESKGRGFLIYLKEGFRALVTYRSDSYILLSDEDPVTISAYVLAVANSSQYGNDAYIAPDASLRDGKLNLVAIAPPGFLSAFILIWRIFAKTIYRSKRVQTFCSDDFRIRLSKPGFFHADGEIFDCGEEIRIIAKPQSLHLVLPLKRFA